MTRPTQEQIWYIFGRWLQLSRIDLSSEKAAQADIEALLEANGTDHIREHRLGPGDIVDFFLLPDLALEVKMNRARPASIIRQLDRYAAYEKVACVMLVTNRAMPLPATLHNKRVMQVSLGAAWL